MKIDERRVREIISRILVEMAQPGKTIDTRAVGNFARAIYSLLVAYSKQIKHLDIVEPGEEELPEELLESHIRKSIVTLVGRFATSLGVDPELLEQIVESFVGEPLGMFEYMTIMSDAYGVPPGTEVSFARDAAVMASAAVLDGALGIWDGGGTPEAHQERDEAMSHIEDALGPRADTYPAV